ncbi:hypothetical protein D3C72_1956080 [compost metagenome]
MEVMAEVLEQGRHQAEMAPAVQGLEPRRGDIELDGPGVTIGASQGLLQQPDAARQGAALPAPFGKQGGQRGGIPMPAEDIEIAAGPVEPYGQGAHQRHVLAPLPQFIPQPRR